MNFLKKLFGNKQTPATTAKASEKPTAKASQGNKGPLDRILNEASADTRASLIREISDDAQLEQLIRDGNAQLRDQVRALWLERLMAGGALPANAADDVLIRIASLATDSSLSEQALAAIKSEESRAEIARSNGVARVRQAAAATLSSAALLQEVLDHAQGSDKAVYRICKNLLADLRAEEEARQAIRDRIEYIRTQAKQLIRLGMSPDFVGRLQVLEQRWDELKDQTADEDTSDIPALLADAGAILEAQRQQEAAEAALAAALEAAGSAQKRVIGRLEDLIADALNADAQGWQEALLSEEQAWADATREHSAPAPQQKRYDILVQNVTDIVTSLRYWAETGADSEFNSPEAASACLQHIHWPADIQAPDWLMALRKTAGQKPAPEKIAVKNSDDSAAREKIAALMAAMDSSLSDGQEKEAAKQLRDIQKLLDTLSPGRARDLQAAVRLLSNRLYELRDWQGFAVAPKKDALCEQMEALVGAEIAPDVLADRIKALQDEWKTLGHSNDREQWDRFREAADKAFEPCKVWFAEQAEIRAGLVKQREALIAELTRYEAEMNWESADWKAVQNTLNAARDAFRTYSPVDRGAHQKTQAAFKEACDRIYAHLKAEYDRNLDAKKAIVEAAEKAAAGDDANEAADTVKKLQQEWKTIGVTPRGPDQRLWQQLRKAADGIFARLNEARDARKAELNASVSEAETQVTQACDEALAAGNASALNAARDLLRDADLPKSAQQRLLKAISDVEKQLNAKANAEAEAAAKARWTDLIAALRQGKAAAEVNASELPANVAVRWNEEHAGADATELCIAMEILAGVDTPDAEQTRRMELQVQRLAQGLGKGLSKDDEVASLISQLFHTDATDSQRERFIKALETTV